MSQAHLAITNLSKTFPATGHTVEVLRSLNMEVQKGEFVSIVGPSGCGKSTLLHLIAGLDEPTSGQIIIDGAASGNRLGTSGYMQQKPLLLPWKTVRENVLLGSVLSHLPTERAGQKADELLKIFGLAGFSGHHPAALSGGMAQRVALLRTILFHRDFLLMDEPFGALDALTRRAMQLWLQDVWEQFKSTVVCVTHDIREAVLLSDRIYVLSGRPAQVVKEVIVDLPRPRGRYALGSKEALRIQAELESLLLSERDEL
jgi:ABC-type nitrate/sulfonate/bicarbonate transport system ATPase subunit